MYFRLTCLIFTLFAFLIPQSQAQSAEWKSPHDLAAEENAPVSLIPFPSSVQWDKDSSGAIQKFFIPDSSVLITSFKHIDHHSTAIVGGTFVNRLNMLAMPQTKNQKLQLWIEQNPAWEKQYGTEGYQLNVRPKGIEIKAVGSAGFFYAIQTLGQMIQKTKEGRRYIPCATITDKPAFAYRGFMHDVGRNYQTIESLKKQLDEMASYKINVFHWHLTDHPAWRPECRIHPELNDPRFHQKDRDVGKMYSYEQILDLIAYAKERHILIIPELDMPGHSDFFKRAFGFPMESPEGMDILDDVLEEFCRIIPKESCPFLHLGTDEVKIKNPDEFLKRMTDKTQKLGRTPIQWKPGLEMQKNSVAHLWSEGNPVGRPENQSTPYFDSSFGYQNNLDNPYHMVRGFFFRQLGGKAKGDAQALGPILCMWPDVRVDDKSKIERHNAQWPGVLAFAERAWKGCPQSGDQYASHLPPAGTEARKAFDLFEKRLLDRGSRFTSFPYWAHSGLQWNITESVSQKDTKAIEETRQKMISGANGVPLTPLDGACMLLRSRKTNDGLYQKIAPGTTLWAQMKLTSPDERKQHFIVGFDAPSRASRRSSGIPQNGQWCATGVKIWLNGKEIPGPQWKEPGKYRYLNDTWFQPPNEIPFVDEEFWWTREPVVFTLKKGINTFVMELPYDGAYQNWGACLIPVKKENDRWVTDSL